MPTPSKKAKLLHTCQTSFFISFQPLSKRLKFWNLALQMPPGNPDESALQVERPKENTAVNATQGCQMLDRKYDKCLSNL